MPITGIVKLTLTILNRNNILSLDKYSLRTYYTHHSVLNVKKILQNRKPKIKKRSLMITIDPGTTQDLGALTSVQSKSCV